MLHLLAYWGWDKSTRLREGFDVAGLPWSPGKIAKIEPPAYLRYISSPLGTELAENTPTSSPGELLELMQDRFDGLTYNPITDEFAFDAPPEPQEYPFHSLRYIFGSITAISLFKSLFNVYRIGARSFIRRLITNELGHYPSKSTNYRILREIFLNTPLFQAQANPNHSHGESAAARTTATRFMDSVAVLSGHSNYCYQMSSRDQSENKRGERTYYWAKDVSALPQYDEVENTDFVTMVDVDYYVDMPQRLAAAPQPHMLFTIIPEHAGRSTDEYSYSFNSKSEICFSVTGGAKYQHQLWNYCTDWFTVTQRNSFGIPVKSVIYDVTTRRISPDKAVVLLVPMKIHYGFAAWLVSLMGRPLERVNTSIPGGFTKLKVVGDSRRNVSVARQGTETACTIPVDTFNILVSTKHVSPQGKLSLYQIKSLLPNDLKESAAILNDYFNNATDSPVAELYYIDPPAVTQFAFAVPDPTDKPAMVAFATPFVPPAFVPVNNKDSSDQSIKGRVIFPREQAEKVLGGFKMTPTKQRALNEFVMRLVPKPGQLQPFDPIEIASRQTKPGQKRDLVDAGFLFGSLGFVKTFMKKEGYGKPTDPRNITTFAPNEKVDYAAFMYPIMDFLKEQPWYAFGRKPREVAHRVGEICTHAERVSCPDISRMDGYVNVLCRALERAVALRLFDPSHHGAFTKAHEAAFGNVGITSHGTRYDQEFDRGSGEMGTSAWNTVENAFVIFYSKYLECRDFDTAWKFLEEKSLAGGDDSIVADIPPAFLIRGARDVGFILKCPTYIRGDVGVNFLARVYGPDVWEGCPDSMCSIKRQMEKLHLTPSIPLAPSQKLFEKATSFALTDANTPIIGEFCAAVLAVTPGYVRSGKLDRFGDDISLEDQYPNNPMDWMMDVAKEELSLLRVDDLIAWFKSGPTLDELLKSPTFYETGREFTYDEWDPEPGLLIARTLETLEVRIPKPEVSARSKKYKPDSAQSKVVDLTKLVFGETLAAATQHQPLERAFPSVVAAECDART